MGKGLAFTKDKNQIATPWHIVEFLSELLDVTNKRVLDPTAGHGAMLQYAGEKYGIELDSKPYEMICDRYPDGHFINASLFDSADWIKEIHPDAVLMNPPFNVDKTKGWDFVLFTANAVNSGYLAAIVPTGAVADGKKAIDTVRTQMMEKHTLEAVLQLNQGLFYPAASVGTVCMIWKLGQPHSGQTWFADFSDDGLVENRTQGRIDKDGVWADIKNRWLNMYREKPSIMKSNKAGEISCALKAVSVKDNWNPNSQIETDPELLSPTYEDFYKTVRDYMEWKIKQDGLQKFLKDNPHLLPTKQERLNDLKMLQNRINEEMERLASH